MLKDYKKIADKLMDIAALEGFIKRTENRNLTDGAHLSATLEKGVKEIVIYIDTPPEICINRIENRKDGKKRIMAPNLMSYFTAKKVLHFMDDPGAKDNYHCPYCLYFHFLRVIRLQPLQPEQPHYLSSTR